MKQNRLPSNISGSLMTTACFVVILAIGGCCTTSGGPQRLDTEAILEMNGRINEPTTYRLSPGDLICLRFLYSPELNNDEIIIGPDGKISLHLVGEIQAAGLTLLELKTRLTDKYYQALGYTPGAYTLGIGDTVSIKLIYSPELNSDVKVRPDRKISLPLIGEIAVAGMTPGQLETFLTDKYAEKLETQERPDVAVIVRDTKIPELNVSLLASASQVVYVGGEVNRPRMINLTNPLKVMNALMLAGGTNILANLDNVVLLRYNESETAETYLLDMKKVAKGKIPDIDLKPYDIVYVPKTGMAQADLFMQHIWHMLPTNILFSFPYNLNTEMQSEIKVTN